MSRLCARGRFSYLEIPQHHAKKLRRLPLYGLHIQLYGLHAPIYVLPEVAGHARVARHANVARRGGAAGRGQDGLLG